MNGLLIGAAIAAITFAATAPASAQVKWKHDKHGLPIALMIVGDTMLPGFYTPGGGGRGGCLPNATNCVDLFKVTKGGGGFGKKPR